MSNSFDSDASEGPRIVPSESVPWADDPRAEEKSKILRDVRESPAGVPLAAIAQSIAGEPTGETGNTDYQFVSRFVNDSDFFRVSENRARAYTEDGETIESGKQIWVEPTPAAFTRPWRIFLHTRSLGIRQWEACDRNCRRQFGRVRVRRDS